MPSAARQSQEGRQIARVLREAGASLDNEQPEEGLEASVAGDRMTRFGKQGFARMRRTWNVEDGYVIDVIMADANKIIRDTFPVAFALMNKIYETVRFCKCDEETGLVLVGPDGGPQWETGPDGEPLEDWTRITDKDRNNWLDFITMHLFEWEQIAQQLWGKSMFARGKWEESFSLAYQSGLSGSTVEDKTQYGQSTAMESRYFGIFQTMVSRQAEALVRSMTRIQDLLQRNAR
jgi:hypothetical protein